MKRTYQRSDEAIARRKVKAAARQRLRLYGLTQEEFDNRSAGQGGACALGCGREIKCVDHDHATGAVRGLVCRPCNTALGALGDNETGVLRALAYVKGTT